MKKLFSLKYPRAVKNQKGAIIILAAVLMLGFVGLAALTVDVHHLWMVQNELQNAADAGALNGARVLYINKGTAINSNANQEAKNAAQANAALSTSGAIPVDVNWTSGNTGDVQRGHWSFGLGSLNKGFYPNDSMTVVSLERSTVALDEDKDFINAVRVVARRDATRAESFFARIFGYEEFALAAEAIGYIGFAGTLNPNEVDQPIAICKQMITDSSGNYSCNTGRMLNSSGGTTSNTAAWTNFTQPCATATPTTMRPLVCRDVEPEGGDCDYEGNPNPIIYGQGIGTINGVADNVYRDLRDCWLNSDTERCPDNGLEHDPRGYPREKWTLTLPVIDCPSPAISTCADAVGAVTVDVVWIKDSNADPDWTDIPVQMEDWECKEWVEHDPPRPVNIKTELTETERKKCWKGFAEHFNLKTWDGKSIGDLRDLTGNQNDFGASDMQKTIVFLPSCEPHEPTGITGGENFGVLSEIPVLVR